MRIAPDKDKPSVAIEIPLTKPLPDYDLEQLEQPTPRDIDGILVSLGFRDLVDDARGILTALLAEPHPAGASHLEIAQLTGAICPGDQEVYRPGLWIVLKDKQADRNQSLNDAALEHVGRIASTLAKKMGL